MKPRKEQAAERFLSKVFTLHALELTKNQLPAIIKQIKSGTAELLYKQSDRLQIYMVKWGSLSLPVVYDRQRSALVTALPQGWSKEQSPVFRGRGY